ncbi:dTDP-4-dehydrorhamnose reductase [Natronorubrum thiooxidans]|uniref:dTDP-4-dehydrorhamnose reductase n=1 Tax=Natronorubrum thiooxidans TaxID=308853 RepID=A0A1N7GD75_9EURY|nr:dTDP-4-dehydrorhamnose reductase [Natronorubrum thiooxidans]SIS10511.1 dTDP-4-dehydrorhamnose reductase [Natronorubrum thiooxidans]
MSVLVLGANGLVGSSLVRTCLDRGIAVSGTYHTEQPAFDVDLFELDIRDTQRVRAVIEQVEPDAVVNCAAYTDVDGCEENPELARGVNADAPGVLAEECAERGISFVHLSTDYVFDGEAEEPYTEDDDPNPIQVYGETKLEGERRVLETHSETVVCRLSFVWGRHGATGDLEGFPAWVLGRARDGESVPLFTDQWVTPTRAGYAAEVVLDLLERDSEGVFHVACLDEVTPYKFGQLVIQTANENQSLLTRGSTTDVDRDACRPQDTCLSTALLGQILESKPPELETEIEIILND